MKNFIIEQSMLHKQATQILAAYQVQKNLIKACSDAIAAIDKGSRAYINTKEQFQEAGDEATAKMIDLHIQYYEVLRKINEPIMLKEHQINNARPLNMVQMAEMFHHEQFNN